MGCALAFQASETSSNLVLRSILSYEVYHDLVYRFEYRYE